MKRAVSLASTALLLLLPVACMAKGIDRDAWYEFNFHGKKVGFLHVIDEATKLEGRDAIHAHRRSVVTVRRQDHVIRMEATTDAWSDPKGAPLRFTHLRVESGDKRRIEGYRDGAEFVVKFEAGGNLITKRHPLNDGVVLASTIDSLFKTAMKVGKSMAGKAIIEEDGELRDFTVKVIKKDGAGFIIESNVGGVVSIEKVDANGLTTNTKVERLGAEFNVTDRETALHLERTEDIFTAAKLVTKVRLPRGDDLDSLVVRMISRSGHPPRPLASDRQKPKRAKGASVDLEIRVEEVPVRAARIPVKSTKHLARFLRETEYESIKDERIATKAREVVGGASDTWTAARAINSFVHRHITNKSLARAFSTANEALASGEGDCTEHAVLFSALAKVVGIPTKLVTGLVYVGGEDGVFGYHQWVEVWVGKRWVAMDPTFGQDIADPTHIKFTEGVSDADGLRDAGIAAAELFGDIELVVVEYTTVDGKRTRI